jgi:hypothetical protein
LKVIDGGLIDLHSPLRWHGTFRDEPSNLPSVKPQLTVISAGEENPVLPERLQQAGVPTLRTDVDGAIHILTAGKQIEVTCFIACPQINARINSPTTQPPQTQESSQQQQIAERCLVFMIFLVLRERKASAVRGIHSGSCESWEKQRDRRGVLLKRFAMVPEQFSFFASHHHAVHHRKINEQNTRGYPRSRRDASAERQNCASQVQRIPRVRVRSGNGQLFLLVQISRRKCAKP